jgi:ligand-binding SRPBCC domain-containing protein
MRPTRFLSRLWVPAPIDRVFAFFADAANLQALTPPWVHFAFVSRLPVEMRRGALIEYRLRIRGLPLRWTSEITRWEPPHVFVDEQRRGPYRLWVHTHRFTEARGGTIVDDQVRYRVPGGVLVDRLIVGPDVRRIFRYRREALKKRFA